MGLRSPKNENDPCGGLLRHTMLQCCEAALNDPNEQQWLIFDGPVESSWVDGIEKGMSNVGSFLYSSRGFGQSRAGTGIQAKNKSSGVSFRKKLPCAPFLIPGFGKQGGSIKDAKLGLLPDRKYKNKFNSGIINSSRGLCFPTCANKCKDIKSWKKEIYKNLEDNISSLYV